LHYLDANEDEVQANEELLQRLENAMRSGTPVSREEFETTLQDFIVEARQLNRRESNEASLTVTDLKFTVRDMLTRTPIDYWPLPRGAACPCAFCNWTEDPATLEEHLRNQHAEIYRKGLYYSPVALQVAGLTGISIQVRKKNQWKCPFSSCTADFGD
jgi:hypothetical protein